MDGSAKIALILELKNKISSGLAKAKATVNSNISDIKKQLIDFKATHSKAFKEMTDQVPGLGNAISLLTNPYALATAALIAFGTAGVKAAQWSNDFANKMAEVNVTAQLTPKELDKLSNKLVEIGTRNVAPLENVPDAFNRIISAGLDVNTSLKVLEPTLKAAKAGFADMETVAAAGVGVMKSSGEDINKVYDILFATLNKGNAKFTDIAQYLPKIVPLARGAGFALNETAAAWAYLTAQGQSAEQATTGIMNAIKAFSNPDIALGKLNKKTGKMEGGLASIGIQVYDDKGKIRPLTDIIESMQQRFGKLSNKEMAIKLDAAGIVDMEAKGALLSMMQDVEQLKEITDSVVNSQGALNQAYINAKQPMDSWKLVMNQFKGNVVKPFGDAVLGVFSQFGDKVMLLITNFKTLYANNQMVRDGVAALGKGIEIAMKIAWAPIKMVINLVRNIGSAFAWVAEKFTNSKLGQGIESFYNKIRPYFIWIKEVAGQIGEILFKFVTLDFKGSWEAVQLFKMPSIDEIKARQKQITEATGNGEPNPFTENPEPTGTTGTEGTDPNLGIDKITGNAKQIRNITINIDSFNKGGINTQNTQLQHMDASQIEEWFNNALLRVIRNVELSY